MRHRDIAESALELAVGSVSLSLNPIAQNPYASQSGVAQSLATAVQDANANFKFFAKVTGFQRFATSQKSAIVGGRR